MPPDRVDRTKRKKRISLNLSLILIFIILSALLVASNLWITQKKGSAAAIASADRLFSKVTENVTEGLWAQLSPAVTLVNFFKSHKFLTKNPQKYGLDYKGLYSFIKALESNSRIYSVYLAYKNSELIQVIAARGNNNIIDTFQAPPSTSYIIRTITINSRKQRIQFWSFLDIKLRLINSRFDLKVTYDPRKSQWYQGGYKSKKAFIAKPFIISPLKELGMSVSHSIKGKKGVIGVDILLSHFGEFLKRQQISSNSKLFLFNDKNEIIFHQKSKKGSLTVDPGNGRQNSGLNFLKADNFANPAFKVLMARFFQSRSKSGELRRLQLDGSRIIARVTNIGMPYGQNLYLGIFAPVADFTTHLNSILIGTLQFTTVFLLIAIALLIKTTHKVSDGILALTRDARQIQEFNLSNNRIDSNFAEIYQLIDAFSSMKKGLRTFGLYTPKTLVRELVLQGLDSEIGGQLQRLSILYIGSFETDQCFDELSSGALMSYLSSCLDLIQNDIYFHKGVVDRYRENSLLVFWNAPRPDPLHEFNACQCLLKIQIDLKAFNAEQKKKQLPEFNPTFGLHTGDLIVGNIGNSNRMEYTLLGPTLSQTNQLQEFNKHYGTYALISGEILKKTKDRLLTRYVDEITLKDGDNSMEIYELIGLNPNSKDLPKGFQLDNEQIKLCRIWKKAQYIYRSKKWTFAKTAFQKISNRFPEDKLSKIYISRCEKMEKNL